MSETLTTERYRFDGFEFEVRAGELTRNGTRIPLRPQAATVLTVLLREAGRLVERERLQEALWGDTAVDAEAGLNHCVRQVRLALGERASGDGYVQTEPRRGYRFVGQVDRIEARGGSDGRKRLRRRLAAAAAVAILLLAAWSGWSDAGTSEQSHPAAASTDYRQARWLLERGTPETARRALPMLRRVVESAPDFGPGHADLARALAFEDHRSDLVQVRDHVERARELAPQSPEALLMTAFLQTFDAHEYEAAETSLREAVRRAPDWVAPRHHLAALRALRGRNEEAIRTMHGALALDPASPLLAGDLAWFYFVAGRWQDAVTWADRTLELDPDWAAARSIRFHAFIRYAEPESLRHVTVERLRRSGAPPAILAESAGEDVVKVYWRWRAAALAAHPDADVPRAMAWAALNEPELALRELHEALEAEDRSLLMLVRDPRLAPLHGSVGFDSILDRLALTLPGHSDAS